MLGIRLAFVLSFAVVALAVPARADTVKVPEASEAVALLPLDAEQRLAIYGQPVASEIARALVAGGIDVVVVGPKMAMPERAKLVVDGTITANKADLVVLTLRVRNPSLGTTLATTQAEAQGLANIDKAAAELSAKILPIVRKEIQALRKPVGTNPPDVHIAVVPPEVARPMLLALTASSSAEPLRVALDAALAPWAEQHHRKLAPTDPKQLTAKRAASTVKQAGGDLAMVFEVKRYAVTQGKIPFSRARVHVRISDAVGVLFDRVVVTDSVLGDKGIAPDALAARTAREVLDILRPHLRRLVASWR